MSPPGGSARRAVVFALLASALLLALQTWRLRDPHLVYTRFDLPAFDAYVYVAMAEEPRVFTVAPWGYRVLTPTLAHAAAAGDPARVLRGFRTVNFVALVTAAVLIAAFALRLGLAPWAALAGVAVFTLSPPVAELVRNPFLSDAVTVALEAGFLLAIEAGAGPWALAPLAAAGALAKESFLLLIPAAYFARRGRAGDRRALALAAAPAAAALAVTLLLRRWWTPDLATPLPELALGTVAAAAANLRAFAERQAWAAGLAALLLVTAVLAARRAEGRALLARYAYPALVTLAAPFFNPVVFSIGDVRRLLVHALPVLLPVLLAALPGAWRPSAPARPSTRRPLAAVLGMAALAVIVAAPLGLDRYRRADLQGPRDGPFVLAFCRQTLRTARRLERGETVTLDPGQRQFQWGVSDPGQLDRMRWFLGPGWGRLAHYGSGDVVMQEPRAELVLPSLDSGERELTLSLGASRDVAGLALVNGRALGQWRAPGPPQTWRVPPGVLRRGDNVLALEVAAGDARDVRLERLVLVPVPGGLAN